VRVLNLEGGCNFRDIGGYPTSDKRTVRWGQVFRAGVLSYFSDTDYKSLAQLNVRAICDLRMADEREQEPTKWPGGRIDVLFFDDKEMAPGDRILSNAKPTVAGMRAAMIDAYRAFPRRMETRLRGLFRCLEQGQTPLIIHCAAGKDRTGIAVAILLSALGVSRDIIIDDYLLTNESVNYEAFIGTHKNSRLGAGNIHHNLLSLPAEVRAEIFKADADYLQAALEEIDMKYGGMDAYLETEIGINDITRQHIADLLLL
jgi:protein-tyrosine phosphatase